MRKTMMLLIVFLFLSINIATAEVRFTISVHTNNVTVESNLMTTVTVASLHNKCFNETRGITVAVAWQPEGNYSEVLTLAYPSSFFLAANQSRLFEANITVGEDNAAFSGVFTYTAQSNGEFIGQRQSTLNILSMIKENDRPSLGVSDYEQNVTMGFNENKTVKIARVYNEGPLDMIITATWAPITHASSIQIQFTPNNFTLAPYTSSLIYAQVHSGETEGNYSGRVEFDGDVAGLIPANYTGPITVSSGAAHATFRVGEFTPQPSQFPTNLLIIGAVAIASTLGVALTVKRVKNKRKTHRFPCERCSTAMTDQGNRYHCKGCGLVIHKREK